MRGLGRVLAVGRAVRAYAGRVLISFDQSLNTVLGGFEDETFSSRMGRRRKNKDAGAAAACAVLDALQADHCAMSIEETPEGETDAHHLGRVIYEIPRDPATRLHKVPPPEKAAVLPCGSFDDNGSLGCLRCGWNLAAHSRVDQERVLGENFVRESEQWWQAEREE